MAKIAFIDLLFNWPPDGGARVDLKEIMTRLSAFHEVTLLVPDFLHYFPRGAIRGEFPFRVMKLPFTKATFNAWHLPRAFRREIRKLRPDRIFIGDGWYLKFPLAAALRDYAPVLRFYAAEGLCIRHYGTQFLRGRICPANYPKDPFRCTRCAIREHRFRPLDAFSHEFLAAFAFTPLYRRWVLKALRTASNVIVYNSSMRDALAPYAPRIVIAPSGVDPEPFAHLPPRPPGAKCALLMTSRSGDESKGFGVLVEAVRALGRRGIDVDLVVPTYSTPSFRDEFIKYTGWRSQEALPSLYADSDICVVPSVWREPFGIAAVEAMAAGKPVVASRSGGLADIVDDGRTGILVEPGDAAALAAALERLISDPRLRLEMGSAGREKARRRYAWDVIMRDIYLPLFPG